MMRDHMTRILKVFFCEKVYAERKMRGISQEQMAGCLEMACRTYADLEHGISGCSALTLVLFLIYHCDDPVGFLNELKEAFEEDNEKSA